jgi:hypothetical protein
MYVLMRRGLESNTGLTPTTISVPHMRGFDMLHLCSGSRMLAGLTRSFCSVAYKRVLRCQTMRVEFRSLT